MQLMTIWLWTIGSFLSGDFPGLPKALNVSSAESRQDLKSVGAYNTDYEHICELRNYEKSN